VAKENVGLNAFAVRMANGRVHVAYLDWASPPILDPVDDGGAGAGKYIYYIYI